MVETRAAEATGSKPEFPLLLLCEACSRHKALDRRYVPESNYTTTKLDIMQPSTIGGINKLPENEKRAIYARYIPALEERHLAMLNDGWREMSPERATAKYHHYVAFRVFAASRFAETRQEADIDLASGASRGNRKGLLAGPFAMELAGLEPATPWVRSRCSPN